MVELLKPKKTSTRTKTRPAQPAKRVPLSLRVTPQLKAKLDDAATETGRSQTQEIEFRLERSFDIADMLWNAMELGFGREGGALVVLIARAMTDAGRMSGLKTNSTKFVDSEWTEDPFAYQQAINAAMAVLKALRPPPSTTRDEGDAKFANTMDVLMRTTNSTSWGEWFGKNLLSALSGGESTVSNSRWLARMKEMLGPVANRASKDWSK